jgi:hypothetical protein
MTDVAGYTGVVYDDWAAGYSSAEGYTGVVTGQTASGYTGAAPIVAKDRRRSTPSPSVPKSSYDATLAEPGMAPGSDGPADYQPPLPLEGEADLDQAAPPPAEAAGGSSAVAAPSPAPAQAAADPITGAVNKLAVDALREDHEIQLSPPPPTAFGAPESAVMPGSLTRIDTGEPVTEEQLAQALRAMQPPDVFGQAADALTRQWSAVMAAHPPTTALGAALQGAADELSRSVIQGATALAKSALDPGAGMEESVIEAIGKIRRRLSEGDSLVRAINVTLNPMVTALDRGRAAVEFARDAARAHAAADSKRAIELSREFGRSVVGSLGGLAAAAGLSRAGAELAAKVPTLRRSAGGLMPSIGRVRPPTPPTPPAPPSPPAPPRVRTTFPGSALRPDVSVGTAPDNVIGTIIHGQTGAGATAAPVALTRPNPAYPQVPELGPRLLGAVRQTRQEILAAQRAAAAQRLAGMSDAEAKNARASQAKAIFNSQEVLTALELQRVHPDRAYLTQIEYLSVVTVEREVPIGEITGAIDPKHPGRIEDIVELQHDRTWSTRELKTGNAFVASYPRRGDLTAPDFKRSSDVSLELRKTTAIIDYARQNGGQIRVRGQTLDGKSVELRLDPARFGASRTAAYGKTTD